MKDLLNKPLEMHLRLPVHRVRPDSGVHKHREVRRPFLAQVELMEQRQVLKIHSARDTAGLDVYARRPLQKNVQHLAQLDITV